MQKQEKRRELRLKRFWRSPKTTSSEDSTGYESPTRAKVTNDAQRFNHLHYTSLAQSAPSHEADSEGGGVSKVKTSIVGGANNLNNKPTCSLPLLQVWPSQPLLRQEGFIQLRRNSGPEGQRDSPRGEADGQSFIFPAIAETSTSSSSGGGNSTSTSVGTTLTTSTSGNSSNSTSGNHLTLNTGDRRNSLFCDTLHAGDSGIDSVQASPSPNALPPPPGSALMSISGNGPTIVDCGAISSCNVSPATTPTQGSPNLSLRGHRMGARASISIGAPNYRRKSSALLHPDHARLFALRMKHTAALERAQTSPDQTSIEDATEFHDNGLAMNLRLCSASSSTTSSLTSVAAVSLGGGVTAHQSSSSAAAAAALAAAAGAGAQQRVSDPWLQPQSDRERDSRHERRRSSTMTARYSLFDALDLEYALLRAAARGSVGPYSLSESIHKLTFTQSLAFPALARGLASKRRRSNTRMSSRPLNPNESGLNTCAKVITAVILVAISFMVFLIVYKFVRT
ncbi:serine-rich adhesin for platelets isoform X1 [Lucilia cuprina]|uniref:serine-rich adhesin for platelets isoform X1 n=1 Tax=Lucilia cuprina TaxID=7375 RepID=UPI001F06CADA|nr:serine-rich adhesin for platelets isoform X1 [Lucilia cuprina]